MSSIACCVFSYLTCHFYNNIAQTRGAQDTALTIRLQQIVAYMIRLVHLSK